MSLLYQEEVQYYNQAADITLSGTLTLPSRSGSYPAVILIAGYGPNDRDVTGMGHKYFKVLAEYLTGQGIGVLRYDKRGVGKSTGNWATVTSKELASDVLAGITYLKTRKEVNPAQIGVIGLSEGGLIAALVAEQSPDINFIVLMAPYIAFGVDNMVNHASSQLLADVASVDFIERDKRVRTAVYTLAQQEAGSTAGEKIRAVIRDYVKNLPESQKQEAEKLSWAFTEERIDRWIGILTSPAYRFFLTYDPVPVLKALTVPVLMLVGDHDKVTPPDSIIPVLESAFGASGKKEYEIIVLPKLNHVFQTCQTGALAEYATITETMAPRALQSIAEWVLAQMAI